MEGVRDIWDKFEDLVSEFRHASEKLRNDSQHVDEHIFVMEMKMAEMDQCLCHVRKMRKSDASPALKVLSSRILVRWCCAMEVLDKAYKQHGMPVSLNQSRETKKSEQPFYNEEKKKEEDPGYWGSQRFGQSEREEISLNLPPVQKGGDDTFPSGQMTSYGSTNEMANTRFATPVQIKVFMTPNCQYCKLFYKTLQSVKSQYIHNGNSQYDVTWDIYNMNEHQSEAQQLGVRVTPATVVYVNGKRAGSLIEGNYPADQLMNEIKKRLTAMEQQNSF